MKNMRLIVIFILGISTLSYAQKSEVKTYTIVCETCKELRLDDYTSFNKKVKYSHINSELIVDKLFKKRDTMIWYYILTVKDQKTYRQISVKNREDYIKKYGKIYKVKRKTPNIF